MSSLRDLSAIQPTQIWPEVAARIVGGERITMAVVELPPGGTVPEHRHENEQIGLCLSGSLVFRVGEEKRELGPGGTWCILANIPHEVESGPDGAVVVEVFSPIRDDWDDKEPAPDVPPRWPI
jgi:quercetin dioxygenase-like cupin family protein